MKGTEKELIEEVKENMKYHEALSEFIDNGFEHCNSKVEIKIDYKKNKISFSNDGYPIEKLNEIVSNFSTHIVQNARETNDNCISHFGKGFKKGFLKLGDMDNGCTLRIFSKNKNFTCYASITAKYDKVNDDCIKSEPMEIWKGNDVIESSKEGTLFEITNLSEGFWKALNECGNDVSIEDAVASSLYLYCADRYGLKSRSERKDLFINEHKVEYTDYCRLENLGNKINEDGIHTINGIVYWIQTYKPKRNNEYVRFKCVYTYVPRSLEETLKDKTIICPFTNKEIKRGDMGIVGYYTFRGNRMMDCGGNIRDMFTDDLGVSEKGIASYHRGGANRMRVALFTDEALSFFGIKSNKGNGIEPLKKNERLREFSISGISIYNILSQDARNFAKLIKVESDNSRNTKEFKIITTDMLSDFCTTASERKKEKAKKRYQEKKVLEKQNISDNVNIDVSDILSFENTDEVSEIIEKSEILNKYESHKHCLYAMCNKIRIKYRNADLLDLVNEYIKTLEEYECTKTSNTSKRA